LKNPYNRSNQRFEKKWQEEKLLKESKRLGKKGKEKKEDKGNIFHLFIYQQFDG